MSSKRGSAIRDQSEALDCGCEEVTKSAATSLSEVGRTAAAEAAVDSFTFVAVTALAALKSVVDADGDAAPAKPSGSCWIWSSSPLSVIVSAAEANVESE